MPYTVYENGDRAEIIHPRYPNFSVATYYNKRDAEIHAYLWCYSVTKQEAEKLAPSMDIGVEYEFGEFPIKMKILEETS